MWLTKLLDRPFLKNIRDAVATIRAFLFFLTPLVSAAVVAYLTWGKRIVPTDIAITIVAALLVIALLAAVTAFSLQRSLPTNAYEVSSMESTLLVERVGNHHRYTSSKDMVVKAKRSGIRLIDQKWFWTGQGTAPPTVRSTYTDHVIFDGGHPESDRWTYRWVYLGRALAKGETARVGVVYSVEDDVQPMRPFFTEGGKGYSMKSLKLAVRFPAGQEPKILVAQIWKNRVEETKLLGELPVTRSVDAVTQMVDYVIALNSALISRRRRYGIRWQW